MNGNPGIIPETAEQREIPWQRRKGRDAACTFGRRRRSCAGETEWTTSDDPAISGMLYCRI